MDRAPVNGIELEYEIERAIPGAFDQAVADADTFFAQELPAGCSGRSGASKPAASCSRHSPFLGRTAPPVFRERRELLLDWLPNVESFELPGANHLLHVQNPGALAEALAGFFSRHPLPSAA